jgi:NAD(P)-dependent dehydrogenase (short-subunit alcohol dehydrogenase family)
MKRLSGKLAFITGASQGLGRELALVFAREGAAGLALVARCGERLNELRAEIRALAPATNVLAIQGDVGQHDDIERMVATALAAFGGRVDVLVNNASVLGPSPMPYLLDYPLEDFLQVLNVNLIGPFLLIRKFLPAMIDFGGSIVNVTSDAGITGYPGWGAYGISKFGLEGLSQTWAAELTGTGVRVNWVDPGSMNTAMHRAAEPGEDPNQWARPGDVTEVFVYLASDESAKVSGRRFEAQGEWREQAELSGDSMVAQTGVHRSDFAAAGRRQGLGADSHIAHP